MPKKNTAQLIVFRNALLDAEAPVETDTFLSSRPKLANIFNMQKVYAYLIHDILLYIRDTL